MSATASEWAIESTGLAKSYGKKVKALRGVDLRVGRGEVFGLLGPNGAGKSTLVKILMTVIRRSGGTGTLLGRPIGDKGALARVGYLPEHHRFPGYLKGWQVIDFFGAMAGVPRKERQRKTGDLLELVGMTEWAKTPVRKYSKGMRQRIGLAQALVNDPELVLLDEPTDGVDPVGRREIRDVVKKLRDEGRGVLINSHLLGELEMVCDRVAILVKGVVAQQGTLEELAVGQGRYEFVVDGEDDQAARGATLLAESVGTGGGPERTLASGERIEVLGPRLAVWSESATVVAPVMTAAVSRGIVIRSMRPVRPTLEDLFMQAVTDPETGKELRPGADRGGRSAKQPKGGAA